jgi:hypothetical protein
MNIGQIIEKALNIIQLKEEDIKEVSEKEEYFPWGVLIVAVAGLASSIGTMDFFPGIITGPVMAVIGFFIGVGILFLIARLFGGTGSYMAYFRPLSYADILMWVSVIPFIGVFLSMVASIWLIVVSIKITQIVHNMDLPKAAIVVLIPIVVVFVLVLLMGTAALALIGMGFWKGGT